MNRRLILTLAIFLSLSLLITVADAHIPIVPDDGTTIGTAACTDHRTNFVAQPDLNNAVNTCPNSADTAYSYPNGCHERAGTD